MSDWFSEVQWPDTPFPLRESLILVGRRGSEAHGTYVPTTDPNGVDDRDLMGIVIQPPAGYLGLKEWNEAQTIKDVWDVVLYDIRKFVRLLSKANPNVWTLLWLREEDYLLKTDLGQTLIQNRGLFTAKDAFHAAFIGYARGQMYRMTHHQGDPKRGFMGAKRKALVEKYGYDCKNAAHLVRLLHMGTEFLQTGELQVFRTWDAGMLKEIKTGQWSLERVEAYAADAFKKADEVYAKSPLPAAVDMDEIERLLVAVIQAEWAY